MLLTFPNLGNMSVLLAALLREWGIPFVLPPETTEKTVALGSRYAPADACLPLKVILGNFLEAREYGADTAVFLGGCGPCLFGCFSEMIRNALFEANISMDVLRVEKSAEGTREALALIERLSGKSALELLSVLPAGYRCCVLLDKLENRLTLVRATIDDEKTRGAFNRFERSVFALLRNARNFTELSALIEAAIEKADSFFGGRQTVYTVGIVGDIYTTIDGGTNFGLQRQLADRGIYSERSMSLSRYFQNKLPLKGLGWKLSARPYIPKAIGGFARETVGYAAMWARSVDGLVQIHPLNCMPEIVAKSVLTDISAACSVPLLSLVLDELSGSAGYTTRLEAFCDVLEANNRDQSLLRR